MNTVSSVWRTMKVGDAFVVAGVFVLVILSILLFRSEEHGSTAVVYLDSREAHRLPLEEDAKLIVEGPVGDTVLRVRGGEIWVERAPCPHQLCRKMGKIGSRGGIIVCVPNRLFIRIEGEGLDFDGITM